MRGKALVIALATAASIIGYAPAAGAAQPGGAQPTVAVALGDSYISGEAGRWLGNTDTVGGSSAGTDRAWNGSTVDPTRVYGPTYSSGCHRSDVSPLSGASLGTDRLVNLACSGATSANVLPAAMGGVPFKGEAPQIDQLATVAGANRVKVIVLSLGGNDLGFGTIIASCIEAWFWGDYCADDQQATVDAALPAMRSGVSQSLAAIRSTMRAAGYADTDYRLVVQSYSSPVPRGANIRYADSGWTRWDMGCPVVNYDATWVRDRLVPQLSTELRTLASAGGAEFLDLRDALDGREICARGRIRVTPAKAPSDVTAEWVREFWSSETEGRQQETFHPDAYGQKALSRCLTLLGAAAKGNYRCVNTAGAGVDGMRLAAA